MIDKESARRGDILADRILKLVDNDPVAAVIRGLSSDPKLDGKSLCDVGMGSDEGLEICLEIIEAEERNK